MSFSIKGFLKEKHETSQVTEKLTKRMFVVEVSGKYPELYAFDLINDRCDLIDAFESGQEIEVSFNISCREWQGRYFTNLGAWKIQPTSVVNNKPSDLKTPAEQKDAMDNLPF